MSTTLRTAGKMKLFIIKVIHFVSFLHLRVEPIVFAALSQTTLKMKVV